MYKVCLPLVIFMLLFLSGCATTSGRLGLPEADPAVRAVVNGLSKQAQDLGAFKGVGTLKLVAPGLPRTTRVAWIGINPDRLRVEVMGVGGHSSLTFILADEVLSVRSNDTGQHFSRKATSRNLAKLISIPIEPYQLISIFSGQPVVVSHRSTHSSGLCSDEHSYINFLQQADGPPVEVMTFLRLQGRCLVESVHWWNSESDHEFRIEDFSEIADLQVGRSTLVLHHGEPIFSLKIDELWSNAEVPPGAFEL